MFRNPGVYSKWSHEILKPFTAKTWYGIIGILLLTCACIKFIHTVENKMNETDNYYYTIPSCMIALAGALSQQGNKLKT